MSKSEEKWIKALKEKVSNYSEPVGGEEWSKIESEVKKISRVRYRYYFAAAASIVALLGLFVVNKLYFNIDDVKPSVAVVAPPTASSSDPSDADKTTLMAVVTDPNKSRTISKSSDIVSDYEILIQKEIINQTKNDDVEIIEDKAIVNEVVISEPKKEEQKGDNKVAAVNDFSWGELIDEPIPERKGGNITLAFAGGLSNPSTSSAGNLLYSMSESTSPYYSPPAVTALSSLNGKNISQYDALSNSFIDYRYNFKVPISFGLFVRGGLGKEAYWETGLSLSSLSTSIINNSNNGNQLGKYSLIYLGVPVRLGFSFYSNRSFSTYISLGGAIDIPISYSYKGEHLVNKESMKYFDLVERKEFPVQFSLKGVVGLQYSLSHVTAIFFEPGMDYFFAAESPLSTIRTMHPFNFTMQAGLRFSL